MIVAAVLLVVCLGLVVIVNRREALQSPETAAQGEQPLAGAGGFQLVLKDRYLLWIAVLIVLLNVVNSAGEFILGKLVVNEAARLFTEAQMDERQRFVGQFYGSFFGGVNLLGLLLQLFVTSRLMKHLGVRGTLFVLPVLALVSYSVMAVAPILAVVKVLKTLENGTDYSIQNTVRHALFLPTSRDAKYKAKAAIDTFFWRAGDVMQAGIVRAGTALGAGVAGFAWFTVALTMAWLFVAGQIAREHRRRTA
jgi:AAA family ATP:ADP antiporter